MNKFLKYILIITFAITPVLSFAQTQSQTQTQLPNPTGPGADRALINCGNGDGRECNANDLNILILNILNLIFIFSGFIVAAMFIYAGFLMITSSGNTGQIQKAKDIFKRVVIGFLIMSLSYLLVKNLIERIDADEFFKKIIQ